MPGSWAHSTKKLGPANGRVAAGFVEGALAGRNTDLGDYARLLGPISTVTAASSRPAGA